MEKYTDELEDYHQDLKAFHTTLTKLTMTIKEEREGLFSDRTQFSERLYELSDSIKYRINSVDWHLKNLCKQHAHYENKLAITGFREINWSYEDTLYYLFDDFIFNLVSLYDYIGSYFYIAFIDNNEHTKMWSSLAGAAGSNKNSFYYCVLGKEVFQHNKEWVAKLLGFRSDVIHYKLKQGEGKRKIVIDNIKKTRKFHIMNTVPNDLVKVLKLEGCETNDLGVDLQFGTIEIAKKSMCAFRRLLEIAIESCTNKIVKFK